MNNKLNTKVILIAGGSGSGKSIISDFLKLEIEKTGKTCSILRMDNYYKQVSDIDSKDVDDINWDTPEVIDWERIYSDINNVLSGKNIKTKKYIYSNNSYSSKDELEIKSGDFLIVEGLFFLTDDFKNKLNPSLSIYVKSKEKIRKLRREKRDLITRYEDSTFNLEQFDDKWTNIILPMHKLHIHPTRKNADVIIKNNDDLSALKKIISKITLK